MSAFGKGIAIWLVALTAGGVWLYASSDRNAKAAATQVQATPQSPVTAQVKSEADALIRSAVAIRANLTDPDSARVKDIEVFQTTSDGKMVTICGKVNAKNKFGGYVGFKPFIYREAYAEPYQVKIAEKDDADDTWNLFIKKECLKDKLEAEKKMK